MTLLKSGDEVDKFNIIEFIGEGSYGEVYKVEGSLNIQAMKILKRDVKLGEINLKMEEGKKLADINHENVIRIFEANTVKINGKNYLYFIMEFIDGITLSKHLKKFNYREKEFMDLKEALNIIKQVCEGICACHNKAIPIIHKDIKAENILLTKNEDFKKQSEKLVKISDFGLVTSVDEIDRTILEGSPNYISPDKTNNSTRRDVYSIGVLFYFMLTNEMPYKIHDIDDDFKTKEPWKKKIKAPSKINNSIYNTIDKIILTAINPNSEKRYSDAETLLNEIEKWENRNKNLSPFIGEDKIAIIGSIIGLLFGIILTMINPYFIIAIPMLAILGGYYSKYSWIPSTTSIFVFLVLYMIFYEILNLQFNILAILILVIIPFLVLYSNNILKKII